jgi:uncharacterized membrane protein
MNAMPPDTPQPTLPAAAPAAGPPREGWAVGANRGVAWWGDGWRLFTRAPLIWIVITLIYAALMVGLSLLPVVGHIAATVLTPVLAAGVLLGCRALERGGELTVGHLFAAFGTHLGPLALLGVLYVVGWIVAFLLAAIVAGAAFGFGALSSMWTNDPMHMLGAFGLGALVMALLLLLIALPLLMAYWYAPALVALRGDQPFPSLGTSFTACVRNIPPFLLYGLLGIVFAFVATIPLGLGWLVLGPVFAASVYASYKDIFGD